MKNNFPKFLAILLASMLLSCSAKSNLASNDNWVGEPYSGFRNLRAIEGKKYMVSSGHQLASAAGAEILAKGGNAIDAAIATQLVLNVVEPHSSGIGGGAFLLYYDHKSDKMIYFNGRETAPAASNSYIFLDKKGQPREFSDAVRGGLSVGTPGLLKAMKAAHETYGKLPWSELFQPAIKAAREGFPASNRFHALSSHIVYLKDFKETAEVYLDKNGQAYKAGDIIKNPKLADTLEEISREGIKPFYEGKIANDIVQTVQNSPVNPGYLSLADLKNYHIRKGNLVCADYRKKYKVCTMPMPGGGVTLLQILGILENFDLAKLQPNSPASIHLIVEATRLAYADRSKYVADIANVPVAEMLDKNYLKKRAALIQENKAMPKVEPGQFKKVANDFAFDQNSVELPSTTHISVVDASGNAVAMTSSIEYFFGSALSVDGFLLNNQLTDFSFLPEKNGKKIANRLEPCKQPRSAMSPTFVFDQKGKLIMVLGSPGGPRIIQSVAKTIINHLDFGLDLQQAISLPSFIVLNDVVELEKNCDITKLASDLHKMGHKTKEIEIVSGIAAISLEQNKVLGASDPRREGVAVGF